VVSGGLACVAGALLLGALIPSLRNATLAGPGTGEHTPTQPPLSERADLAAFTRNVVFGGCDHSRL
jgi:hypothetical protein